MIGTLTALAFAYWFYSDAERYGKPALRAGLIGFLAYFIPGLVWTFTVGPVLRDVAAHNPGAFNGLLANYAYIVIGVLVALAVKRLYFAVKK
ncbi:MAG: hypothetical protein RQ715_04810 [Methylococcales bacterium]|nr:hypothetical protein [Methylococcales bacterium]